MIELLGLCGSLRAESSNLAMLRACARLLPADTRLSIYDGIAALPAFNPDLDFEGAAPPPAVAHLRDACAQARGFVLSSPEYAHGVPGALKNALDWLVSGDQVPQKPILLVNASPAGGEIAQRALAETLRTMSMNVLASSILAPALRKKPRPDGTLDDAEFEARLRAALAELVTACR